MKKMQLFKILFFITFAITVAWGLAGAQSVVNQNAYFDTLTGHKYIKNIDASYSEFSKNGKLFKSEVPNNLPLLNTRKSVIEIKPNSWFLYAKPLQHGSEKKLLPASALHPQGWRCEMLLTPQIDEINKTRLGLGYTISTETIKYNGKELIAFGSSYYDFRTGHKYFKNSDNTYSEYSKLGKMLRTNVPNNLPLLTSGKSIVDLNGQSYILYEKKSNGAILQKILTAMADHPQGWYPKQVFLSAQ